MRYYEEFSDVGKTKPVGGVIAVYGRPTTARTVGVSYQCLTADLTSTVSETYLEWFCRPITERAARAIDPKLFERLGGRGV